MSTLTSENCLAAFITALQNNKDVTDLLGDGKNSIGCGTVTADTQYPYILVYFTVSIADRRMGRVEGFSNSAMRINIFAEEKAGTPAQETISEISEAVDAALSEEGAVTIAGRDVEAPVFNQVLNNTTLTFSESKVVSFESQAWNMFSSPN